LPTASAPEVWQSTSFYIACNFFLIELGFASLCFTELRHSHICVFILNWIPSQS